MAVLTRSKILAAVKQGNLTIDPFDPRAVGPASVDLHLGNTFRVFSQVNEVFQVTEEANFEKVTKLVTVKDNFLLLPGQTAHGITRERIVLPDNLCAWIQGRSRFSRLGLMVHITASFVQPGTSGYQVLEMSNAGPISLSLVPGIAICQLVIEETSGQAKYQGRFKDQEKP